MADIHILEQRFAENGAGHVRVAFHLPVPAAYRDGTEARYPADASRESEVPDVGTELAQIQAGTLYEHVENFLTNRDKGKAAIAAEISARWHGVAAELAVTVKERYENFGATLARS